MGIPNGSLTIVSIYSQAPDFDSKLRPKPGLCLINECGFLYLIFLDVTVGKRAPAVNSDIRGKKGAVLPYH
jgi:hypothetical protein